ncbi:MAG TPA: trimethylamine methyltransferase family protein [Thermoleophilia bacterium]|nr:trimethylamine methyltransferase family protein [Thermoleophilia bacterium]
MWRAKIEAYEPPPIDPAAREQLAAFVTRRRAELGD